MSFFKNTAKHLTNIHRQGGKKNIFLFATPRGGSTWFLQLVSSQPGVKFCDEPLDIRSAEVREHSGINDWKELYSSNVEGKYKSYFSDLIDGTSSFRTPNPLRAGYRFLTNRVVLKVIHGGVDRINWFKDEFDANILYCIRHPIAVSLSRKELPYLPYFLESDHKNNFTADQQKLASDIIISGSTLEKGVLAWCIHNSLPLREIADDWVLATYEQAVMQPDVVIDSLCDKLDLTHPELIRKQLNVPSPVINESDSETVNILKGDSNNRIQLIRKWKNKVSDDDEKRAMDILNEFGIYAYKMGNFLPDASYWIGEKPKDLV